jgi:hypothetical protein
MLRSVCGASRSWSTWATRFRRLPLPSHVATIQDFPRPTIIKELKAFLGMVNFYRQFLPSIACTLEWSAAMDAAFAGASSHSSQ